MPGRPDFSQSGTDGGGQHVAVQERPDPSEIDAVQTGSVAAGSTETVEIYAPTGAIYDIKSLYMKVNSDGTATGGDHSFRARPLGSTYVLRGDSNYNTQLQFVSGHWKFADLVNEPPSAAAASQIMTALTATESSPIIIEYLNNTDAAQDNARNITLLVNEVSY